MSVFLIFLTSNIFADDFAVTDVIIKDVIKENQDFNIDVVLSNNSTSNQNIDLNILIYSPQGALVSSKTKTVSVNANSSKLENINYIWGSDIDTTGSINSHVIYVKITNDPTTGAAPNNIIKKYFVISKEDKTTPVPDFPMVFSLVLVLGVVYFFSYKKINKNNK
jgi:hypothetical protein